MNSRLKHLSATLGILLLAGCASTPEPMPPLVDVEARDVLPTKPTLDESHQLDEPASPLNSWLNSPTLHAEDINATSGELYKQGVEGQPEWNSQIESILNYAEHYIQEQDFKGADRAANELNNRVLDPVQSDRLAVINAYVANAKGEHVLAISLLQPLLEEKILDVELPIEPEEPEESLEYSIEEGDELALPPLPVIPERPTLSTQQIDALLLSSFSFQALGDYDSAIDVLITREGALTGSSRNETTRYIWQVINSMPVNRRALVFNSTQHSLVRNRIEQSLTTQLIAYTNATRGASQEPLSQPHADEPKPYSQELEPYTKEPQQFIHEPQQFNTWLEGDNRADKHTIVSVWGPTSPRIIAVLLPTSSKFNKAAQAVKDGIDYQHSLNTSPFQPQLQFYDIGDNPDAAPQYYVSAIQSGADLVIGPLGKDYANQISDYNQAHGNANLYPGKRPSTLLLGGDVPLNESISRFTMSPEMEGVQIAERAWQDGHLSAGLLVTNTKSSQRTVAAFTQKWLDLGGKISAIVDYSPAQYDHSVELKKMFNINQSHQRYANLSDALGFKPKFSAYQRSDIDFILMIADTNTGRLIRPQVNFFSGSKVPVYSTSRLFDGIQNEVSNFDLNNTHFPVMPWVLKSAQVAPYAGQLNMLFALGSDAYSIAANFQELRQNKTLSINGNTGKISINNRGEAYYRPIWATFRDGAVVPFDTLGIDITPLTTPNDSELDNQNVNGIYNDDSHNSQAWNKQTNTNRKTQNQQEDNGGHR